MKCKVFKLHPQNDSDESKLNKFLETVAVKQIFAEVVGGDEHFWSVLAFYEDKTAPQAEKAEQIFGSQNHNPAIREEAKTTGNAEAQAVTLTPKQESVFNELKKWRNEKAALDGIPPYLIANNFSLVQIAVSAVETKEDLIEIKGFGEKRAEKYGDEILAILGFSKDESEIPD